mmetsp:Transcript_27606/g.82852  ORF Transcript_27606/g.82852 Transcript_27606/m.82852 type:complete len:172 (+) Transcript_27606:237-752(+)
MNTSLLCSLALLVTLFRAPRRRRPPWLRGTALGAAAALVVGYLESDAATNACARKTLDDDAILRILALALSVFALADAAAEAIAYALERRREEDDSPVGTPVGDLPNFTQRRAFSLQAEERVLRKALDALSEDDPARATLVLGGRLAALSCKRQSLSMASGDGMETFTDSY